MASFPSDELAERRARRDGHNVAVLEGVAGAGPAGRIAAAEHEVAVLTARLGETVAERDRVAGLAASRRGEIDAGRDREGILRARVRDGEAELARVREQLALRTAAEASLRVQATGLHARIHALRAQAAGHDARMAELAAVVDDLRATAGAARGGVEHQLAARAEAEEALAAAQRRAAELEEQLGAVRAELDAVHAARDRTLGAEERARAARAAEWAALRARAERVRPTGPPAADTAEPRTADGTPLDLAAELARAAERLRGQATGPDDATAEEPPAELPAAPAPPAPPPRATPPPRRRPGDLRRRLRRLLARRS